MERVKWNLQRSIRILPESEKISRDKLFQKTHFFKKRATT